MCIRDRFCLAQVLDASTSGRAYIVSEYVDGPSLQQAGRRGAADLQRIAVATATALDAIHQAGVVHGDLTPSNVLLGPDGARVVDFGIAGALGSGMKATSNIVGTPAYMAPEQLAGKAVGAPPTCSRGGRSSSSRPPACRRSGTTRCPR